MMNMLRLIAALGAAFFMTHAQAQNAGTVTNHAFAIGKGAGTTGYTSLLCASAQLAVGQSSADPICQTITGDVTISSGGVTAIGTAKVTSAMLRNSGALSVIGRSANSSGVPGDISCTAASDAVLRESGSVLGCGQIATNGIANNAVTLAKLATQGANTVLANATSGAAVPTAFSMPSCSTSASALNWTTSTGFGCNTAISVAIANVTGLGSGVGTALGINVGSAGAFVTFNGAAGTPSSITLTNGTGLPTTGLTGTLQAAQEPAHTGDVTNTAGSLAMTIANNVVTYAKFQQVAASSLVGNATGSLANATGITLGSTLAFSGSALQTAAHTGDVTTAANSFATTIAANAVTNAKMATMGAYTLKANNSGSSASPTDMDVTALTLKASPGASDIVLIQDVSASNAFKKTTVSALGGGGSGVSTLNGQTGALVNYFAPQHRITLASGVPVMATSQSGATTVYVTPYAGNMMPIYDGTNMIPTAWPEVSQATTDTTKSPAAVAASKVYDIFCWIDSGTNRCTRGQAWTNSTTRGYTLTMTNGIMLNTSSITNGPAALRGTWVGTIASNGSSTIDFTYGAAASGGSPASFNVWNAYNRVQIGSTVTDNGAAYGYTSATIRQARGAATMQVSFVSGAAEDAFQATLNNQMNTAAVANATLYAGLGYDSTTTFMGQPFQLFTFSALALLTSGSITHNRTDLGVHTFSLNERSDGTNSNGFNNASLNSIVFSGRM